MGGRDDVPFWGLTPQEIYVQLTGGPGAGRLSDASSAASQEWQREEERAHEIRALATDMKSGWEGQAGAAAHGAAGPLAAAALRGAVQLRVSDEFLNRQIEVFQSAANSVVPVPEKPESSILNDVIPWETDLDREIQAYQADAQRNIDVFRSYDTASLTHETPLATEYSTVTHSGGDISVRGPGDTFDSDYYRRSGDLGPDNYSAPGGGDGGAPGGEPTDRSPVGGSQPDNPGSADTQPSRVSPSAPSGPGLQPGVPSVPQPGPTHGSPTGTAPLAGITGWAGGSGSGVGGGGGRGGGAGGGAGSGGTGGRGGPGVRAAPPGAGALGAAEQAAQRAGAAAGARGTAGPGGVPMGAGGRGKDTEDTEHQCKVLIEPDPEDVFGTDTLTAPQVIGDPRYEDE